MLIARHHFKARRLPLPIRPGKVMDQDQEQARAREPCGCRVGRGNTDPVATHAELMRRPDYEQQSIGFDLPSCLVHAPYDVTIHVVLDDFGSVPIAKPTKPVPASSR
jgi:hypothetical protein